MYVKIDRKFFAEGFSIICVVACSVFFGGHF